MGARGASAASVAVWAAAAVLVPWPVPRTSNGVQAQDSRTPTRAEAVAVAAAIGCETDATVDGRCARCPPAMELSGLEVSRYEVVMGRFGPGGARAAWVTIAGCASRAAGEVQRFVVVLEGRRGSTIATLAHNDGSECVYPMSATGREHIVCAVRSGQQGCYDSELLRPQPVVAPRGSPDAVLGLEVDRDCADRDIRIVRVTDLDGDGDDDLVLRVDGAARRAYQAADGTFAIARTPPP